MHAAIPLPVPYKSAPWNKGHLIGQKRPLKPKEVRVIRVFVGGQVRDRATVIQQKTCSAYGTHSMRRTKAAQIYKKTGNLRAVQLLLGHTKLESTVRYLGVEVDDALSISEQVEL